MGYEYEILPNEKVNCRIITKYKENMITPIDRPLNIADIYYFFSCRVFQDKTPFTSTELALLGLERYSVYDIIRKTRGITPYDNYWLRFDGDKCDYEEAKKSWDDAMSKMDAKPNAAHESASAASDAPKSDADINEILNQHKVDVASKFSEEAAKTSSLTAVAQPESASSNTMSESEIEALLLKSGLSDLPEPDILDEPKSSSGTMSDEDIAKMLAEASASVETVTAPAEEAKPSGGKMSEDEIEKLLAAAGASVESVTAPAEEAKPSGSKMSDEDIAKLLAESSASVEEAATVTAEEAKSSGGKMSDEDIAKLLAESSASVEEAATVTAEEAKPSGSKMSDEDIAKLLAESSASVEEAATVTTEETKSSGGKMSDEDIAKLLAESSASVEEAAAVITEEVKPSGGKMSDEDIEKMLAAASEAVQEPLIDEPEQPTLEATNAVDKEGESSKEPKPAEEAKSSGGKMSQADIEALLNGMAEDVK